jgi:hypothetical protein
MREESFNFMYRNNKLSNDPNLVAQLKVMPLKKWGNTLEEIPGALEYLKAGKTSAEKISFTL